MIVYCRQYIFISFMVSHCSMLFVKPYKLLLKFSIFLTIGGLLSYYAFSVLKPEAGLKQEYLLKQNRHPLVILGFQFKGYDGDQQRISIKAAKHSIDKRKMGFISLGSDYIARYKNAVIDIHGQYVENTKTNHNDAQIATYSFNAMFSKEVMPILSQKDISALIFEPAIINFFNGNNLITQVQANSATIKAMDGRIFLKGQISAESASRILSTDRLTLISDSGLMETNSNFILKTPEKQITGKSFKSDIVLNTLKIQ